MGAVKIRAADRLFSTVRSLFDYSDGQLIWKRCISQKSKVGERAGGDSSSHGYRRVRFYGELYGEHQIVFLWHNGYIPKLLESTM